LRVRSSAFGHKCEYVLRVKLAALCPMARCTVTTSHPDAWVSDAYPAVR
jgi:hypothetical protein